MILFDPDRICITKTERIRDLPGSAERLIRHAPGLKGTWVNGVQVFDGERYSEVAGPGHVLTTFLNKRPTVGMPSAEA